MAVNLKKGQKVELKKPDGGELHNVIVGLGWDPVEQKRKGLFARSAPQIDCDASAIVLTGGKLAKNKDVVYFGHLKHGSGAIKHMGDNLTGAGEGDDEQIMIKLDKVPAEYDKIVFVVNIYQADKRGQHFGMIKNAFVRLVDEDTGREILRYDLSEDYDGGTAMIFGEVYRHNNVWKFGAVGQATNDKSVGELAARYQ